jgi:hypothetical protein
MVDGRTDPLFQALRDIFPGWACIGFEGQHPVYTVMSGQPDVMEVAIHATFRRADEVDAMDQAFFDELHEEGIHFLPVPVDMSEIE